MKVRGTTITTPIARHAVADDSVVSRKPWSSKNMVDKFGIVETAAGADICITDSSSTPLNGLRIIGADAMGEDGNVHIVGGDGSVTVKVEGKNIADLQKVSANSTIATPSTNAATSNNYDTTITTNADGTFTVTQSKAPSTSSGNYQNGFFSVGFYCPLKVGDVVTISFDFKVTENLKDSTLISSILRGQSLSQSWTTSSLRKFTTTITEKMVSADNWNYIEFRIDGKSGVFSNFQIEYGSAYTGFEEYKEPQTLTVPTPGGLLGNDVDYDEIDFAKGLLIRRCLEQTETPLPADVMEAYSKLHTYKPTTRITNDYGAEMVVEYVADTKTYIDNKFAELQNAILSAGANV